MEKYRRHFLKVLAGVGGAFLFFKFFKTNYSGAEETKEFSSESPEKAAPAIAKTARRKFERLSWKRLSSNDADAIKSKYKVVVIGSGYGASVAAARLSEKVGGELCLLERGREFVPGEYPSNTLRSLENFRFDGVRPIGTFNSNQLGLFNVTSTGGIDVVSGNALGGGSNINANVILEPLEEVFKGEVPNINKGGPSRRWPLQIDDLRPYFKKVRTMLKAERFRAGVWVEDEKGGRWEMDSQMKSQWKENLAALGFKSEEEFDKLLPFQKRAELMRQYAAKYRRSLKSESTDIDSKLDFETEYPPLAVNLSNFDTGLSGKLNHVGVPQRLCNQCGDCVSGCNTGAKNTLIMNYLPLAKNHGASLFSQVEVNYVEKLNNQKNRYRVHYRFFEKRFLNLIPYTRKGTIDTDHVVFGAGSLGSTKILLKSEKYGGFKFSEHLGASFSGNGDGLSAIEKDNLNATNIGLGSDIPPFIEGNEKLDKAEIAGPCITTKVDLRKDYGIMFQDASMPSALGGILKGKLNDLLVFLTMGYDSSSGKMSLTWNDNIQIDYPKLASEKGHWNSKEIISSAADGNKGTYLENPRIKYRLPFLNSGDGVPVTVHALGGCSMGDDNRNGVINSAGQVFVGNSNDHQEVYPGLYVTCGAALPTSVGANPLLTISAFAERVSAYMLGQPDQNDPQKHEAQKYQVL